MPLQGSEGQKTRIDLPPIEEEDSIREDEVSQAENVKDFQAGEQENVQPSEQENYQADEKESFLAGE